MKQLLLTCVLLMTAGYAMAKGEASYPVQTKNTTLLLEGAVGEPLKFIYYGPTPASLSEIYDSGTALRRNAYPTLGNDAPQSHALQVKHVDGNMSLELVVDGVAQSGTEDVKITEITLKDKVYPFTVKLFYKAYVKNDVIETWAEYFHTEQGDVALQKFASAFMPLRAGDHYLTHLHGTWGNEQNMVEELLTRGSKVIKNRDGVRNTQTDNPSFMITIDGKPSETKGNVIAGTLVWTGPYKLEFDYNSNNNPYVYESTPVFEIVMGMNDEASEYYLPRTTAFKTPEMVLTYSTEGKGGASRNLHRWARDYKVINGHKLRDILINSWEGVYFDVNQEGMDEMMRDFASIGGELFVMDDGWFGDKYPRDNDVTSLGDWTVAKKKLPGGIEGLTQSASKHGVKFGIWIEPEMTNLKSELYEKHPDWIICQDNREPVPARGGTQLVLDMSNPKVQDFVFSVVDNLMTKHPEIAFIKWDANMPLMNYGSMYLPRDRQSHLYVEYHRGFNSVMERIRAKYPNVVMQACASGGGRVNYGYMQHFDEFWTSDDTDAHQRLLIQWGTLNFFPAMGMASHVSTVPNHLSQRVVPLKFRFDVAMTGRLGMEMLPKDMTATEREYAIRAIADYKSIRPLVQQGDLYKLVSPYENNQYASLMYVAPDKDRAVLFAYRTLYMSSYPLFRFVLDGLDPDKNYRLSEISRMDKDKPALAQQDKIFSGRFLMNQGLTLPVNSVYGSAVVELTEVK